MTYPTMTPTSTFHSDLPRHQRQRRTNELLHRAVRARQQERDELVEEVILTNASVARSIAQRYGGRGIPVADLEQVAYLALVRAAHRFDVEQAEDFLTFAVPTIRGEIKRWFRDRGWTVRPPRTIQEAQQAISRVEAETGRHLPAPELARRSGVPEAQVREAQLARGCFTPTSLDAPVRDDGSAEAAATTIGDLLPGVDGGLDGCETRLALAQAIGQLPERDRMVLRLRFLDDLSQAEIGAAIGVTQTQVSRILVRVVATLRAELEELPLVS